MREFKIWGGSVSEDAAIYTWAKSSDEALHMARRRNPELCVSQWTGKEDVTMTSIKLYRGIPEGKSVWNGDPNGKIIQAPEEKGYYDLFELVDKDNNHVRYRWEKSYHTTPEVSYSGRWHPMPDSYWG